MLRHQLICPKTSPKPKQTAHPEVLSARERRSRCHLRWQLGCLLEQATQQLKQQAPPVDLWATVCVLINVPPHPKKKIDYFGKGRVSRLELVKMLKQ